MVHVVRRLLGAFLVLAIVAGATLALSSRPRLQSDRNAVERDWRTVQPGLSARYSRVDALARAISPTLRVLQRRGGSHTGDHMPAREPGGHCPRDGAELLRRTVGG